jgi:hypothetical protein
MAFPFGLQPVLDDGDKAAMRQVYQQGTVDVTHGDGFCAMAFQHDPAFPQHFGGLRLAFGRPVGH